MNNLKRYVIILGLCLFLPLIARLSGTVKSYGTQVWNKVPSAIRLSSNLLAFKKSFRALLLPDTP